SVANFGGGAYGGILSRCLFAGNRANNDGGGVNNATVAHGTMTGNTAANGGGAAYGTLFDCAISGNKGGSGGGMYNGTLANCTISGNTATGSGGGAYGSVMTNCVVSGNASVASGGGTYNGTMVSCLLSENVATGNGGGAYGGALYNCTVAGNHSAANNGGGGVNGSGNRHNCIIWGNSVLSGAGTNYVNGSGTFLYTCTGPNLPGGAGNIAQDPMFRFAEAGDFRLLAGSPCIDAGTNFYAYGATDVLGNPRIQNGRVDMGAYEGAAAALLDDSADIATNLVASTDNRDGVLLTWEAPGRAGSPNPPETILYRVLRWDEAAGKWVAVSGWITELTFLDTGMIMGVEYTYAVVTAFDAKLEELSVASASATGQRGASWYVDAEHGDDANDGMTWATAKQTIQPAIDLAVAGETVAVTNGVYAPISTTNQAIIIRGVNGANWTVIDGGGTNRCATLGSAVAHTNIVLAGFTLTNGKITGNGGGVCYGTLTDCVLTGNAATGNGGGSYYSILYRCTVSGNNATGNSLSGYGGGAYNGTLNNCVLARNTGNIGGGAHSSVLNNCTVTGNTAGSTGGGTYNGTLNNCIVWGNAVTSGTTMNYSGGTFRYSCASPIPSGVMNIDADPLFRFPEMGDYRLTAGSLCLDAGTNFYVVGATDVAGNARIQNGTVDMGAYEGVWGLRDTPADLVQNLRASDDDRDGILISWDPPSAGDAALYRVLRFNGATGQWEPVSDWIAGTSFLDTQVTGYVETEYAVVAAFDLGGDAISIPSPPVTGQRGASWFVDASRPDDGGDGQSWATAKRTIQAAFDLAVTLETVAVTNGVYAPIASTNKAVFVRSVEGAGVTIIDGGGTNRCATLGTSSAHTNIILTGFMLTNGKTTGDGGGVAYGTLSDCILSGNTADYGGGSYYSILCRCTLSGNTAHRGGGSYYGTLNNCTLTGNTATYGGGAYNGTLNNCVLARNVATTYSGGGAYASTLNNCTVTGNRGNGGGGTVNGTMNNCIVWGNATTSGTTTNYSGGTFRYSCAEPIPMGGSHVMNIAQDPLFRLPEAGDFRLLALSPCLDTGTNFYVVGATDLAGNARIQNGTVDMGAYEGIWTLRNADWAQNLQATVNRPDGILVSWEPPASGDAILYRVCRLDFATGQWTPVSDWIAETAFLDTQMLPNTDYDYAISAAFDAHLDEISTLSAPATGRRLPATYYVDASRTDDQGDALSWATAKQTLQAAIGLAAPGDGIVVTNGVYTPVSTYGRAISIHSVNGAAETIIDGGGIDRCATLGLLSTHTNTVLCGFTLRNGWTSSNGGGVLYGRVTECVLTRNTAHYGGGGASECELVHCSLTENVAYYEGGGAFESTLYNCTVTGNMADDYGGGASESVLYNCVLSGNEADEGGGVSWSTLYNCTVTENTATRYYGGGTLESDLYNSIVWGNYGYGSYANHDDCTFLYSCSAPLPGGAGNIAQDPLFRFPEIGDYRLLAGSFCLDTGNNAYAPAGLPDLLGNPRIQNGRVDMGAYEGAVTLCTDASDYVQNLQATADLPDGILVSWEAPAAGGAVLYRVLRWDAATGEWVAISGWIAETEFLDTQVQAFVEYVYAIVTAFDLGLDAISDPSASVTGQRTESLYVDAGQPDDTGDGRSWATAKRTIQAAIDLATHFEGILVTDGVYAPIVTDNKAIAIRSVNGAGATFIDGGGTNRCATLRSGVSLRGFTLRNGCSEYGGGAYRGTLYHCVLPGNRAEYYGGGAYGGTLYHCVLTGNMAQYDGGGADYCVLNNCTLSGNTAEWGGGAFNCTLNNSLLTGNKGDSGGGARACFLYNCTVAGNRADIGGGTIYGDLYNCIVWGNAKPDGTTDNSMDDDVAYSCTNQAPLLRLPEAGDYRLLAGSPCLDTGSNQYAPAGLPDLLGNPRIQNGTVDMGAYEGVWPLRDADWVQNLQATIDRYDGVLVSWEAPASGDAVLYRLCRQDLATGRWMPVSDWIADTAFFDTSALGDTDYGYAVSVAFDANLDEISTLSAPATGKRLKAVYHVDASRADDSGDALSWATAKQTIQAAITLALPGDEVIVTNGVYAPIVTQDAAILIHSVEGAEETRIDGGGIERCATLGMMGLHTNTVLRGFTLTNGWAESGGGTLCGTLEACVLSGNNAVYGGGAYEGTLIDCTLTGNTAEWSGGGAWGGTLNHCVLSGNAAGASGGGAWNSTGNNCMLSANTANSDGGGAYASTLNNCVLSGNVANQNGGGMGGYGILNNCTLTGNVAHENGGGMAYGTLNNCTLSGNVADGDGGGAYSGTLNNCIVWGNTVAGGTTTNYSGGPIFRYSCAAPLPGGVGNIALDPLFMDELGGNFRLQPDSPCIDAGTNFYVVGAADLDGKLRIMGEYVDMGAYEFEPVIWISPSRQTVAYAGGVFAVSVHCESNWTVACAEPWVVLGTTTGSGDATVSYTVASHAGEEERTAILVFACEDTQKTLTLTQYPRITELDIGTGAAARTVIPFNFYYNSSAVQTIYLSSELALIHGETIVGIDYFYNSTDSSDLNNRTVQLWLAHTALDDLSGGWIPQGQFTKVYEGAVSVPRGPYTLSLSFDTPFPYTNGNLCVMAVRPMDPLGWRSNVYALTTDITTSRTRYYNNDDVAFNFTQPGELLSAIPNTRFRVATGGGGGDLMTDYGAWLDFYGLFDNPVNSNKWVAHPNDPNGTFRITNFAVNAAGAVTALDYSPDLAPLRVYTPLGKTNLTDATPWGPTNAATRFFLIRVSLPD
ncbi:MAG: hypothetical protein FWG50_11070, partial [Kiritimatiellaeota bacterium]|nr:hypothetical protein [Kiritimatiellota bacterium]